MQPFWGNQRPGLLTYLMNMSLVLRLPGEMRLCRSSSNVPRLPTLFETATKPSRFAHFWRGVQSLAPATHNDTWTSKSEWREHVVFLTFWLRHVLRAATAGTFSTCQLPKVLRCWCVLYAFTSKRASRQTGVHFFDVSTSKSGRNMRCFVHVHFEISFVPQRRALFRHLNFQKWSEPGVFCTFWLRHVLRATTACNFSSLIWPAGSAPAALASLLFDPPEPQIIRTRRRMARERRRAGSSLVSMETPYYKTIY